MGDKSQRDALIAGLDSERPLVREAASSAMSYLNESPRADLLLRHLNDSNPRVRENLVRALGRHRSNPEAAIPKLIEVIRTDSNLSVTTAAQKGARRVTAPAVIEPVMEALRTERDWTRRQQLVQVLNHERVRPGFTQDQEYRPLRVLRKGGTERTGPKRHRSRPDPAGAGPTTGIG
ncbi:MAG: hypothetical protein KatS3mg115_1303 [Candidatus Poribacteria bacterium]|nr:MAG: hypothetical protein KatS3mg115_1303 [Candidatus Poribacteria bacterium]